MNEITNGKIVKINDNDNFGIWSRNNILKLELTPTYTAKIIKLQYKAVLKSFFGNLKRRENKRKNNEVTKGAAIVPTMLKEKNSITDDVLFKKFIFQHGAARETRTLKGCPTSS